MIKLNEKQIRINLIQNDIKNDFSTKMKANYRKYDLKHKYNNLISKVNKAFIRFIIFILLISLCISKQIRKLSSPSSIIITVNSVGSVGGESFVRVLSVSSAIKKPDRIYVNGMEIEIPSDFQSHKQISIQNNENQNEYEITMDFFFGRKDFI